MEAEFKRLYARLNTEQKQAVDTIDGPVMVIAGPGTGKTSILTLRIANILRQTDTDPSSILALTFTESGVLSMREKLTAIIGTDAYKVGIYTFHGFCNDVIRDNPEHFPRIIGSTSAVEVDQVRILERIIVNGEFEKMRPYGDPYFYVRPALSTIHTLKRENISVLEFEQRLTKERAEFDAADDKVYETGRYKGKMKGAYRDMEKSILKNAELLEVYRQYEEQLAELKLYDFEDMILEVVRAIEDDEDLRLRLQERFQYILADEHQDANTAQNRLLELLSSFYDSPNLFIVGDEKQAIFRFQGASLDNFLYFKDRFTDAQLVQLSHNYRSGQAILDASHTLISTSGGEVEESLRIQLTASGKDTTEKIKLYECDTVELEHAFVGKQVLERIEGGIEPRNIAIMYRNNKDAFPVARELERIGVPYVIESNQNILADVHIQQLLLLFRTIDDIRNDELLFQVLFMHFIDVPHLDVYKLAEYCRNERTRLADVLQDEALIASLELSEPEKARTVFGVLQSLAHMAKNKNVADVFEATIHETGYLAMILAHAQSGELVYRLDQLFEEANKAAERHNYFTLRQFLDHIDLIERYNLAIKAREGRVNTNAVRLMTAHKSKGLEFSEVFIIGVVDGVWGNTRNRNLFTIPVGGVEQTIDDERRLMYVAITRAEHVAHISYARERADGATQISSQFISEIDDAHIEKIDIKDELAQLAEELTVAKFDRREQGSTKQEKEFLSQLFVSQGLSVTALNNYLECPWKYFFRNLIRVPEAQTKYERYGSAIHEALRRSFEHAGGGEPSVTYALDVFTNDLEKRVREPHEEAELLKKGEHALKGYFDAHVDNHANRALFVEYVIKGVEVGGVVLRGILDRVDMNEAGDVTVVDYKTSKPMTRNAIMGKTKSSNGNYYRQLIFYKLLFDKEEQGNRAMKYGQIDFVEPDFKQERFEITDAEVEELAETIAEVGNAIRELSFWDSTCTDRECRYCGMRTMMH